MSNKNKKVLRLGDYHSYVPSVLRERSDKALRDEYNRLRRIVNTRLEHLSKSEFAENSKALRQYQGKFKQPASKVSKKDLPFLISELATAATSGNTSVQALRRQRRESIATLREHGYNIKTKDYAAFVEFMEAVRLQSAGRIYDSPRDAELFSVATKKGINPAELTEDLDYWRAHVEDLRYARRKDAGGNEKTIEDYKQAINRKYRGR